MNEYIADCNQIIEEVKERNRFYSALVEIQKISRNHSGVQGFEYSQSFDEIVKICEKTLKP